MKHFLKWPQLVLVLVFGSLEGRAQSADEATLRALDQKLLDAVTNGNVQFYAETLAPEAMGVDEDGTILDRAEFLKQLRPPPPGITGHLQMVSSKVQTFGDFATVIHTDDEVENYHGQTLHAQYVTTESWQKRSGRWQLVLFHISVLARTPTPVALSPAELSAYPGRYTGGPELVYVVTLKDGHLEGGAEGRPSSRLEAEVRDVFFIAGRPRSRKIFLRDATGKVSSVIDRREGQDLVWKKD